MSTENKREDITEVLVSEDNTATIKFKNYRQRYIDLLEKIHEILDNCHFEIRNGFFDHKSFHNLVYKLDDLYAEESNHFAEVRKYRKQMSQLAHEKQKQNKN
ncbi:putative ORFan [Tupanvirus deep ocean]|uniref:ORFan n=2 Tax=Tupanvirus TaxID=2094720 RepID=A0AC62A7I8_9VIRU|nr:putative ORFan [Tupanvirus deep ocean]QKU33643.1 putative ORFan [Tupanvirus deep ocean]